MLATYDLLTALHTNCASDTLPSRHPPHRGGRGKVDPTSVIYTLTTCQLYPTESLQHTTYRTMTMKGGRGELRGWTISIYICIYIYLSIYLNLYSYKNIDIDIDIDSFCSTSHTRNGPNVAYIYQMGFSSWRIHRGRSWSFFNCS